MNLSYRRWKSLFLFCLGLFLGTAFCMKWIEPDFLVNGQLFTIIGLELFYPAGKIADIFYGIDEGIRTILRYHLYFDFVFMAGVYPGITALCMMAREKVTGAGLKKILLAFAALQSLAWACDIIENVRLLQWMKLPVLIKGMGFFHFIVAVKWLIALTAALFSITILLARKKIKMG